MIVPNSKSVPSWGECYYDHFEKYLGQPLGRKIFELELGTTWMQIISYENIFGGCKAFCSFGLSHYVYQIGAVAEVFMPVDDGWDETPLILADTLFYIVQHRIAIGRGLVFKFADWFPDFAQRFDKAAIYFAVPFAVPEGFSRIKCGVEVGEIYLGCYISEAELHFKSENGTDKFKTLLEEKQVDVFNLERKSSI